MTDMKKYSRIFTALTVCLCLLPAVSVAVGGTGTGGDDKEDGFSVPRPRTQEQFDKYMEALYRECGGDLVVYNARVAAEEKKWKEEVAAYNRKVEEWNESHADSPQETITIDDDSNYENLDFDKNDAGGDGEIDYDKLGDDTIAKIVDGINIDNPEITDDHDSRDPDDISESEKNALKLQARDEDSDGLDDLIEGLTGTIWADPVASVEGAVMAKAESMVNTGAQKIQDKFFSMIIESLPFFKDHKKAYEDFVGTPPWTETQTYRKFKRGNYYLLTSQGWTITEIRGRKHNKADIVATRYHEGTGLYAEEIDEPTNEPDWQPLPDGPDNYLDEAPFSSFDWNFGGFKGGDAVFASDADVTDGPVIGNLKIDKNGLSFDYDVGLSSWGLEHSEAGALACLFVQDKDGNWVGGKFEWISTSRTSRSFTNIFEGYNGWDLSNVPKTTTAAFVIVSKDGKKRSNVISAIWER